MRLPGGLGATAVLIRRLAFEHGSFAATITASMGMALGVSMVLVDPARLSAIAALLGAALLAIPASRLNAQARMIHRAEQTRVLLEGGAQAGRRDDADLLLLLAAAEAEMRRIKGSWTRTISVVSHVGYGALLFSATLRVL